MEATTGRKTVNRIFFLLVFVLLLAALVIWTEPNILKIQSRSAKIILLTSISLLVLISFVHFLRRSLISAKQIKSLNEVIAEGNFYLIGSENAQKIVRRFYQQTIMRLMLILLGIVAIVDLAQQLISRSIIPKYIKWIITGLFALVLLVTATQILMQINPIRSQDPGTPIAQGMLAAQDSQEDTVGQATGMSHQGSQEGMSRRGSQEDMSRQGSYYQSVSPLDQGISRGMLGGTGVYGSFDSYSIGESSGSRVERRPQPGSSSSSMASNRGALTSSGSRVEMRPQPMASNQGALSGLRGYLNQGSPASGSVSPVSPLNQGLPISMGFTADDGEYSESEY